MRQLLLLLLLWVAVSSETLLPAPRKLSVSSFNFKHKLQWRPGPGSPPGLTYRVYSLRLGKWKEEAVTEKLWAHVKLKHPRFTYVLCVRSSLNETFSPRSKTYNFTPYLDTTITAPEVALSGCGNCLQVNISLPKPHRGSGVQDLRDVYRGLKYHVSWRRLDQEDFIITENYSVLIPHLLPGSEYCVKVQPQYVEVKFTASSWSCTFTSEAQTSEVLAGVVAAAAAVAVVLVLSALVLLLFALNYSGLLCKVKDALPRPLLAAAAGSPSRTVAHRSLRLERTVPEPVSLLLGTGDWDKDEEDREEDQEQSGEYQEEEQYLNRGADLSSSSSTTEETLQQSVTWSPAAELSEDPSGLDEKIEEEEEPAQVMKNEERVKVDSCPDLDDWDTDLEEDQSVDLFSVTVTALSLQPDQDQDQDQDQCDVQQLELDQDLLLLDRPYRVSDLVQCDVQRLELNFLDLDQCEEWPALTRPDPSHSEDSETSEPPSLGEYYLRHSGT